MFQTLCIIAMTLHERSCLRSVSTLLLFMNFLLELFRSMRNLAILIRKTCAKNSQCIGVYNIYQYDWCYRCWRVVSMHENASWIAGFFRGESIGHRILLTMNQKCRAWICPLLLAWINCWTNSRVAGDLTWRKFDVIPILTLCEETAEYILLTKGQWCWT